MVRERRRSCAQHRSERVALNSPTRLKGGKRPNNYQIHQNSKIKTNEMKKITSIVVILLTTISLIGQKQANTIIEENGQRFLNNANNTYVIGSGAKFVNSSGQIRFIRY